VGRKEKTPLFLIASEVVRIFTGFPADDASFMIGQLCDDDDDDDDVAVLW